MVRLVVEPHDIFLLKSRWDLVVEWWCDLVSEEQAKCKEQEEGDQDNQFPHNKEKPRNVVAHKRMETRIIQHHQREKNNKSSVSTFDKEDVCKRKS